MSNARFLLRTALLIGATAAITALPAPLLSQVQPSTDELEEVFPGTERFRIGGTVARDRERSVTGFATEFFYIPGTYGDIETEIGVRIERQGLDFGTRYAGSALAAGRWPADAPIQGRFSFGTYWDRTTVDFGTESITGSGTGYSFSGGVEFRASRRVAVVAELERQSGGGIKTRRALGGIRILW